MLEKITEIFNKNKKLFTIILIFLIVILFNNKKKNFENMTNIPSVCDTNLYQITNNDRILFVREIKDVIDNTFSYKPQTLESNDIELLKSNQQASGFESEFVLNTPGDNNYVIKYNNDTSDGKKLFLTYNEENDRIT